MQLGKKKQLQTQELERRAKFLQLETIKTKTEKQ
jgi:hypothetical protein